MWQNMPTRLYLQFLLCVFVFTLLIYLVDPINTIVNLLGTSLIVLIFCWEVNNAINSYLVVKRIIPSNGKAVLITGCDSGFGNALALKLNEFGFYVIATCLNANNITAKQLIRKALFPDRIIAIELDVTKDLDINQSYDQVLKLLQKYNLQLWAIVNNAGIFEIGFVEWGNSIEPYKRTIDVNVLGSVRMTRAYLPLIKECGGRIINVSSVAARMTIEGYSAYCMSKHALQAFTDGLRKEMIRFGVRVISIEPSCYRTPIVTIEKVNALQDRVWNESSSQVQQSYGHNCLNQFKSSFAKQTNRARDPQEVINAMIDAIINKEPNVRYKCCGLLAGIIWSMAEILPSNIFDDIWRLISRIEVFTK